MDELTAAANVYEATVLAKPGSLDDFAASHADCANRLTELEATVRLLEEENARLKVDLGAAAFVASERTRNSIVAWLRLQSVALRSIDDALSIRSQAGVTVLGIADRIANAEDIAPP